MKKICAVGIAVVILLFLLSTCSTRLPPEPDELSSPPAEPDYTPQYWADGYETPDSIEQESPSDMGSYVVEKTQPPIHFDLDAIQADALAAAQAIAGIYRTMDRFDGYELTWLPTDAEQRSIYEIIGALGYPVVMNDADMLNTDPVELFCQQVDEGATGSLGVFTLDGYAYLNYHCFSTEGGVVYNTRLHISFDAEGNIETRRWFMKTNWTIFSIRRKALCSLATPAPAGTVSHKGFGSNRLEMSYAV